MQDTRPVTSTATRRDFLRLATAVGAAAVAPLAPPPATASSKKSLVYGLFGRDPGNLSPVIRYDVSASIIMLNLYDGLGEVNHRARRVDPLAAESWAPVDPLTWRIKLREGLRWHKGYGEVTAEDVVYSWNYHFDTKSWQVNTALFAIESVRAAGKHVVEVKLRQPFGAFPGLVMGYGGLFVSKKAHQEMGPEKYSRNPIGNGPFMFESMTAGNQVVLRKNPDYWRKGLPHLEELVFRTIPDSHIRYQALDKGEVDFIMHPDAKDVPEARKNPKLAYSSVPGWNWDYQAFTFPPHQKPDFPNQHKLVRQAIAMVIDREAIRREI